MYISHNNLCSKFLRWSEVYQQILSNIDGGSLGLSGIVCSKWQINSQTWIKNCVKTNVISKFVKIIWLKKTLIDKLLLNYQLVTSKICVNQLISTTLVVSIRRWIKYAW